jgi:hypothetical protein
MTSMNAQRALELLNCTAQPLPAETDSEWELLSQFLEKNPKLAAWFETQSEADTAAREAISQLQPSKPAPARVLTGDFTRRQWLGKAAAGIAASVAAGYWVLERPTNFAHADGRADFAGFREDMARFADRLFRLNKKDASWEPLIAWLQQSSATTPESTAVLPPKIAANAAKGCRSIPWGQNTVGLLCFQKQNSSEVVHLFSTKQSSLAQAVPSSEEMRQTTVLHGRECAGWAANGLVHVLVGSKPGISVGELLA